MVSFYNLSDNEYYVGSNKVSAMYLGDVQVYQDAEPFYTKALGSGIIRFTSQSGVTSTYLKAIRYKKK